MWWEINRITLTRLRRNNGGLTYTHITNRVVNGWDLINNMMWPIRYTNIVQHKHELINSTKSNIKNLGPNLLKYTRDQVYHAAECRSHIFLDIVARPVYFSFMSTAFIPLSHVALHSQHLHPLTHFSITSSSTMFHYSCVTTHNLHSIPFV